MLLPLSWLKELVPISETDDELAELLTLLGLEVDAIRPVSLPFEGIIVAQVIRVAPHPNADNLQIATVFDGKEELQVVCGAPNCRAGVKFPFAPIGARLGLHEKEPFQIKRVKIRGVESNGMLCSFKELGLGEDQVGIAELPDDWTVGGALADRYGDRLLEISLTPNLGHCQSAIGVAREIAAATGRELTLSPFQLKEAGEPIDRSLSIQVEAKELAPRYLCRLIRGVSVGPSPQWLVARLERSGMRSINNVVDATNFAMLESGQPLHPFDLKKVRGGQIVVRSARPGEPFTALDGRSVELSEGMLAICDAEGPIALAGIIGGANSEVDSGTVDVVVESAYFEPRQVMRTARAFGLQTEASKRFERGCDPNGVRRALDRAAALIQQLAGGVVAGGVAEWSWGGFQRKQIALRLGATNRLLGTQLSAGEVAGLLERLGCNVSQPKGDSMVVAPPTYRSDLNEEIDLVEEVGRLYGYHNIPAVSPRSTASDIAHAPLFLLQREVQSRLIGMGLQQVMSCNLISPEQMEWLDPDHFGREQIVEVINPGSQDHSLLRPSLLPGLLQTVRYNCDRQERSLALFEVGQSHLRTENRYEERSQVAIVLTGLAEPQGWPHDGRDVDFYDLKGRVEGLLGALGVAELEWPPSSLPILHPGRQAEVRSKGVLLGVMGELHPATLRKAGVDQRLFFAELKLDELLRVRKTKTKASLPSPYPSSSRDWTVTLPEGLSHAELMGALARVASPLLEEITLLDVYRSDRLGAGVKNVTLRFRFRSEKETLSIEKIDKEQQRLIEESRKILQ